MRQRNLRRYFGWDLRRIAHIAVGTYHPAPQPRLMSTMAGGKVDQIWTQRVHAHLSQRQTTRSPADSTRGERTASVRAPSSLYSTRTTRSMLARRARHRRLVRCPGSPLSLFDIIGCDDRTRSMQGWTRPGPRTKDTPAFLLLVVA